MIAVIVGHENLFDFFRIKTVIPNVGNDFLKVTVYTAAWVNNREFRSAVDDVNVTVQSCRFEEALRILAETEAGSIVISLSLFDNR